ncbi:hypothetical protein PCC6912_40060 [Chlorogloeopsis fritschii PCC 6912]|uniref:CopG-like ribbon-helix-helix domain-containing protein n=1 Tax=Chlorogloeopsis fritschii PCC 6912 TaxID=211165 RepID=A0A3S1AE65_CHLFR|nr:hypothetical protein [Chlorogloeopsis fritschii]RUR77047.1 hypothetical protein PCC6912_40060 [Chlorogloeopsis fritschii PCC 6912]
MAGKWRVVTYLANEELLKKLEEWARSENRSVSNLAATILTKAIEEREKNSDRTK